MPQLFGKIVLSISFFATVKLVIGKPLERRKLNGKFVDYADRSGFLHRDTGLPSKRDHSQSLDITGKRTDEEALKSPEQKRCGTKNFHTGKRTKRYTLEGTIWNSKDLTYTIENFSPDLRREDVESTIERTLQMWSNASQLTFTRVTASGKKADITFKFVTGYHGDGHPTDGPGMEIAHAFSPFNNLGLAGDVHFDDDETFTVNGGDGVDLLWVAVHEVGHSLGLDHTYHPDSVMLPVYKGYMPNLKLGKDDIDGIQHLYGLPNPETVTKPITPASPPLSHEPVPRVCTVKRIDAAVRTSDRNTYIFSGAYFWKLRRSGATRALKIREHWIGLEDNIDAALTRHQDGKTYFFKGSKYWIFSNTTVIEGPLNITQLNLPTQLNNMDAALDRPGTDDAYFFKGDKYWRYNWSAGSIDQEYPQMIVVSWKGLPNDLDAAFLWKKRRVFFLKGGDYYALKHQWYKGVKKGFPKTFYSHWLGCSHLSYN